jgi:DNA-directed RNA polymerase specialized sigma24 family protein
MNDVDSHLKQLALEAQRHPPKTRQRQRVLAKLLSAIQHSGKLVRPYRGQFRGFYEDIYAEARQRLFLHICEKIDEYDSQREVLQWANFLLRQRFFINASREIMPTMPRGVDARQIKRLTIDDLDRNIPPDKHSPSLSQEVRQVIEEDPEGIFQQDHVTNHPAANFQAIALKILSGYSWKEISAELDVKIPTLSSFYQRRLTKFAPKFKEYLS